MHWKISHSFFPNLSKDPIISTSYKTILNGTIGTLILMRRVPNTKSSLMNYLTYYSLQGNVPLRHMLNANLTSRYKCRYNSAVFYVSIKFSLYFVAVIFWTMPRKFAILIMFQPSKTFCILD